MPYYVAGGTGCTEKLWMPSPQRPSKARLGGAVGNLVRWEVSAHIGV